MLMLFVLADFKYAFQSFLALRYEGLLLRELKSATCLWLQVSYMEWLSFAEQSLDNGFYSIAGKVSVLVYNYTALSVYGVVVSC